MTVDTISNLLEKAIASRGTLFDAHHKSAFRLFNGFLEGCPDLIVDLYAATIVVHNYADVPERGEKFVHEASGFLQSKFPWLKAGLVKTRNAKSADEKRGRILFGAILDRKIKESNVWYALDLTMNRDASLYLDTRNLRKWLIENMEGRTVLNAFAYTGSLGVAATAGRACRVVQLDRNRQFLNLAKTSYTLNGFPIRKGDFIAADFFSQVSQFKRKAERFDCVLIDPPFFSETSKGRIDQIHESARLINKIRPLINDGGILIAINNALYVSGKEYMQTLESLCVDGYLKIKQLIPVSEDFTGYSETRVGNPITDPAPFNYSTKITILEVRRNM
ncbi:MAG: class I SAM-dependent methyltransferase [Chloroflexi bacterium]|nr:class I SAM-dependent methyltransferase [Chloroflexota bacterium]